MLVIKILFIISAVVLASLLFIHKFFVSKLKDNMKISEFVSGIAIAIFVYSIMGFVFAVLSPNIISKSVLILFCFSPFIIGKLVNYQTVKFYGNIQLGCIILSAVYALWV